MHETNTSNSYITTTSGPRIKKVTVTVYEYDEKGNIVKETCTETEYAEPTYQPAPYQPYWTTGSTSTWSPGSDDKPLK